MSIIWMRRLTSWCRLHRLGRHLSDALPRDQAEAFRILRNALCNAHHIVIGFDKMEIVEISEKIDTYETSIQPFEDCCTIFVAKH